MAIGCGVRQSPPAAERAQVAHVRLVDELHPAAAVTARAFGLVSGGGELPCRGVEYEAAIAGSRTVADPHGA